jgi:hypothetical protein
MALFEFELKHHEDVIDAINEGIKIRVGQIHQNSNGYLTVNVWCGEDRDCAEVWVDGDYDEENALIKLIKNNDYYDLDINWEEGYLTVEFDEYEEEDDWGDEDDEW